jgi:hypothetical protein
VKAKKHDLFNLKKHVLALKLFNKKKKLQDIHDTNSKDGKTNRMSLMAILKVL